MIESAFQYRLQLRMVLVMCDFWDWIVRSDPTLVPPVYLHRTNLNGDVPKTSNRTLAFIRYRM